MTKDDFKKLVARGNKKLPSTTGIFNMTPATNCISKTKGLCKIPDNKCYALKAEIQYPDCLPYRTRQQELWEYVRTNGIKFINEYFKSVRTLTHFRWNEAGDIKDIKDLKIIAQIARDNKNITFYLYSSRKDILEHYDNTNNTNLIINGSGFMYDNNFVAVSKYSSNAVKCIGSCKVCNLCSKKLNATIEVLIH